MHDNMTAWGCGCSCCRGAGRELQRIERLIHHLEERMSALDDKIAELQADADAVKTAMAAMQAQVQTLTQELAAAQAAGQAPTQAQLDALQGVADQLAALAPQPAPAPAAPSTASP